MLPLPKFRSICPRTRLSAFCFSALALLAALSAGVAFGGILELSLERVEFFELGKFSATDRSTSATSVTDVSNSSDSLAKVLTSLLYHSCSSIEQTYHRLLRVEQIYLYDLQVSL